MLKPFYHAGYVKTNPENLFLDMLLKEVSWLDLTEARKECFMSDQPVTYRYGSGRSTDRVYTAVPFHPAVLGMMKELNSKRIFNFNACFLNRYDTQKNHLCWHADDSPEMDMDHPIAVISFGAEREIWWKEKDFKGPIPPENRQLLESGSLFIMPAGFQKDHLHKIPKADREVGIRVSLTFRHYLSV